MVGQVGKVVLLEAVMQMAALAMDSGDGKGDEGDGLVDIEPELPLLDDDLLEDDALLEAVVQAADLAMGYGHGKSEDDDVLLDIEPELPLLDDDMLEGYELEISLSDVEPELPLLDPELEIDMLDVEPELALLEMEDEYVITQESADVASSQEGSSCIPIESSPSISPSEMNFPVVAFPLACYIQKSNDCVWTIGFDTNNTLVAAVMGDTYRPSYQSDGYKITLKCGSHGQDTYKWKAERVTNASSIPQIVVWINVKNDLDRMILVRRPMSPQRIPEENATSNEFCVSEFLPLPVVNEYHKDGGVETQAVVKDYDPNDPENQVIEDNPKFFTQTDVQPILDVNGKQKFIVEVSGEIKQTELLFSDEDGKLVNEKGRFIEIGRDELGDYIAFLDSDGNAVGEDGSPWDERVQHLHDQYEHLQKGVANAHEKDRKDILQLLHQNRENLFEMRSYLCRRRQIAKIYGFSHPIFVGSIVRIVVPHDSEEKQRTLWYNNHSTEGDQSCEKNWDDDDIKKFIGQVGTVVEQMSVYDDDENTGELTDEWWVEFSSWPSEDISFPESALEVQLSEVEIIVSRRFPNAEFSEYMDVSTGTRGVVKQNYDDGSYLVLILNCSSINGTKEIRALNSDIQFVQPEAPIEQMDLEQFESAHEINTRASELDGVVCNDFLDHYFCVINEILAQNVQFLDNNTLDVCSKYDYVFESPDEDSIEEDDDFIEEDDDSIQSDSNYVSDCGSEEEYSVNYIARILRAACRKGDVRDVQQLISAGADINAHGKRQAPLHIAASRGDVELVEILIEFGNYTFFTSRAGSNAGVASSVDVNITDCERRTALHHAAINGHVDTANMLIAHAVYVNVLDKGKWSPLHWACMKGRIPIGENLIMAGADIHVKVGNRTFEDWENKTIDDWQEETFLYHASVEPGLLRQHDFSIEDCAAKLSGKWTPLYFAAIKGHDSLVKMLSATGAEENYLEHILQFKLAVGKGNCEKLRKFKGIDIHFASLRMKPFNPKPGSSNVSALHYASSQGDIEVVESLVQDFKCPFEYYENDDDNFRRAPVLQEAGYSSLDVALANGHLEVAMFLVNTKDKYGLSPLHKASAQGLLNVVKTLIEDFNAEIEVEDNHGETPLHKAAEWGQCEAVKMLIRDFDAKVEAKSNGDGQTPLLRAAGNGQFEVVNMLIKDFNANVNVKSQGDDTLLHFVAHYGSIEPVKELIVDFNAQANAKNEYGRTPLHIASGEGQVAIVKMLIGEFNVSATTRDFNGDTPLHAACISGQFDLRRPETTTGDMMIFKFRQSFFLKYVTEDQNNILQVVKTLIVDFNVPVDIKNNMGQTPLHSICVVGRFSAWGTPALLHMLIKDFNGQVEAKDNYGETPLHKASRTGQAGLVHTLIADFNAQISTKNNEGQTPLHQASEHGQVEVVRMLINDFNAQVDVEDKYGEIPLHKTCIHKTGDDPEKAFFLEKGKMEVLKILIEDFRAQVDVKDQRGETPLHKAAESGYVEIVQYLIGRLKDQYPDTYRNKMIMKNKKWKTAQQLAQRQAEKFCLSKSSKEDQDSADKYARIVELLSVRQDSSSRKPSTIKKSCLIC